MGVVKKHKIPQDDYLEIRAMERNLKKSKIALKNAKKKYQDDLGVWLLHWLVVFSQQQLLKKAKRDSFTSE